MSEDFRIEAAVIGAGAVGLACARALALSGRETIVLEAGPRFGEGVSSRSSEVVHAGLYYPAGSLKARACVTGRRQLYDYMQARGVPHRKCGKLVVACSDAETGALEGIAAKAAENDCEGVYLISGDEARAMEPALAPNVTAALVSSETGVFDSHSYMLALLGEVEDAGGSLALNAPFLSGAVEDDGVRLEVGGEAATILKADIVVNAAGLHASEVARAIDGLDPATVPDTRYARGCYFAVAGASPFSRLIYPVPEPGGLGVHLTFDLGGAIRFGPDVEWIETLNYDVDPARSAKFNDAIKRYWPGLGDKPLSPAYSGIRPKISAQGEPAADFRIDGPAAHGVRGLINLYGVESPGLTASLALADLVVAEL